MKKSMLFFLCLIATQFVFAQEALNKKGNCSCAFQSYNQFGLLEGKGGSSFQLQTVNGIGYKTWYAGIGVGVDYYKFRSIPLFLDLRKDFLTRKSTPFIYADAGLSFGWSKDKESTGAWRSEFGNGTFYDAGLGYRIGLKNKMGLLFSAGYSFKSLTEKKYGVLYCPFFGPCKEGVVEKLEYSLNRLSLKAGLRF